MLLTILILLYLFQNLILQLLFFLAGRKKKKRIRSDNVPGCSNKVSRKGRITIKYSNCQEIGHNARSCKNLDKDKVTTESTRGRPKKNSEEGLQEETQKQSQHFYRFFFC